MEARGSPWGEAFVLEEEILGALGGAEVAVVGIAVH